MRDGFVLLTEELIPATDLRLPRARGLVAALTADFPYATLVECRRSSNAAEIVILDVEPEVPQRLIHDIRHRERVAVVFAADDRAMPEVLALRGDFPRVSHLNLTAEEVPRSLCLFDEPWYETRLRWTPALLIGRIREWLAKTARGELHQTDQPLEPILLGSRWTLVLPPEVLDHSRATDDASILLVQGVRDPFDRYTLVASPPDAHDHAADIGETAAGLEWLAITVHASPQEHGVIHRNPANLRQLADLLVPAGVDLRAALRTQLRELLESKAISGFLQARLIVIVTFPKTRVAGGTVEAVETRAFLAIETIARVGEEIGLWGLSGGSPGILLVPDDTMHGEAVELQLLNPTVAFTRERAAQLNGVPFQESLDIVAVGAGALGSQVFVNLLRAGYGRWTLIDPDVLLPHNLARHALFGFAVGHPKAEVLTDLSNRTVVGAPVARAVVADVMDAGDAGEVAGALEAADLIVDMSASVAVARYLAQDVPAPARRVSLFLNPTGKDAVLLAEDAQRRITLDLLEMQYYRHLVRDPALAGHLSPQAGQVRYGAACRDYSSSIPQDGVALHAALGSRALRAAADDARATIAIWRSSPDTLETTSVRPRPAEAVILHCGEWTICTDTWVLDELARLRAARLPNETGGVLIGSFDTDRRLAYVVDVVPSPPDSQEWPTLYIRGREGLHQQRERIVVTTAGNLDYVGEWHSHPDGHGCEPSRDDRQVFAWLAELRRLDGLPPLLLIVGEHDQFGWYIGEMPSARGSA